MRVSSASSCVGWAGRGTRFAVLAALYGQLAILAHAALVEHVTCGADGELIHVRADVVPAVPAGGDAFHATTDTGHDEHDHCLLDEDGEAACPNTSVASGEPVVARADHSDRRRVRAVFLRSPLYRLAPKNSPPASSRPEVSRDHHTSERSLPCLDTPFVRPFSV